MNSSENCQNCASTDQITIAGKSFCANCGSAVSSAASEESIEGGTAPSQSFAGLQQSIGLAPSTDVQTATPASDDIVSSLTASLSGKPSDSTNLTADASASNPPVQTTEQPQSTAWVMDSTPASPPVVPEQPAIATTPAPVTSTINKFTPSANVTDLRPVAKTPAAPSSITPPNGGNAENTQAPVSTTSEIRSLDSKDEDVFSDDQFNQLANSETHRPANVQELSQTVSTPATMVPMDTIRPVASTNSTVLNTVQNPQVAQATQASEPQVPVQPVATDINALNNTPASPSAITPGIIQPQPNTVANASTNGIPGLVDEPILIPKKKTSLGKKGAKAATVTLTMAGLLLLGAYVWQVNYPNLALKVASSKAGINASIPGYLPSGWQVSNNISSGPGTIAYQIDSSDGKASATVNESKTDWDSQALAENYVSSKSDKYLSLQAAGLTIYVYGNQASWVNNGTWYRIEGNNTGLNQDQLIRMATSL